MNSDYPIVVGLGGLAGVGKTVTAENLVPGKMIRFDHEHGLIWDHLFFAIPLYSLASIRQTVLGELQEQRQLYQVMEKYLDLFNSPIYGGPEFAELVELAYETVEFQMPTNEDEKPREFFQFIGTDRCRMLTPDVFVSWIERTINQRFSQYVDHDYDYIALISDVRFPNEGKMIMNQPNGLVIKLDAQPEIRAKRISKRDGKEMNPEHMAHKSETAVLDMPFDIKMNTDHLSIEEQVSEVSEIIYNHFKIRSTVNAN